MNIFLIILPAVFLYGLGMKIFAGKLSRVWGEDDRRVTPAHTLMDGRDYVPTRTPVLFAHHFSAIAAAGPILGPTMALLYGYLPVVAWILFGAVLIGCVHDYACLYVSVREGGKSMAEVARHLLGTPAFILFALFIIFSLVLVNAVFINLTAVSLTSVRSLADLGLPPDQTIFRLLPAASGDLMASPMAKVGGIASTSSIVLTFLAPFLGYLLVKRNLKNKVAYPLATFLCVASVILGFVCPVHLSPLNMGFMVIEPANFWIIIIALYVLVAATVPVWLILQPREFISVQFLYLGIFILVASLIGVGIQGISIQAPPEHLMEGEKILGWIWPTLFITVACGAISGFHGLVSSGTSSKMVAKESDCRKVGYGAMIGESALALCVTLAIAVGMHYSEYLSFVVKPVGAPADWKSNPVLAFSVGVAGLAEMGLGIPKWLGLVFGLLMVEGFVLDTLDVSVRLNRYLLEEVWKVLFVTIPALLKKPMTNSLISVVLMLLLSYGNTANLLWPIFGSANQLLAALSLFTITLWMKNRGIKIRYVMIPAVLVALTTLAALFYLLFGKYLPDKNYLLCTFSVALIFLAISYIGLFMRKLVAGANK